MCRIAALFERAGETMAEESTFVGVALAAVERVLKAPLVVGFLSFGIGVALTRPGGALFPCCVYLIFQIDVASDVLINLLMKHSAKMVKVEVEKADCYKRAAVEVIDCLHALVKDPTGSYANQRSIEFGRG